MCRKEQLGKLKIRYLYTIKLSGKVRKEDEGIGGCQGKGIYKLVGKGGKRQHE